MTLSERVDSLQDAEANSDLDQVESLARDLGDRALRLGYPSLAEVAGQAAQACVEGKSETVRGALEELTEVARRVRQGHRGAA
ncbi:MAG: hypothetical protein MJE66_10590 [Proteobacteria bacterium]|nr:hypothetical protein [Pseudomonadota bacterium]